LIETRAIAQHAEDDPARQVRILCGKIRGPFRQERRRPPAALERFPQNLDGPRARRRRRPHR
jgi:hypothetical protein